MFYSFFHMTTCFSFIIIIIIIFFFFFFFFFFFNLYILLLFISFSHKVHYVYLCVTRPVSDRRPRTRVGCAKTGSSLVSQTPTTGPGTFPVRFPLGPDCFCKCGCGYLKHGRALKILTLIDRPLMGRRSF